MSYYNIYYFSDLSAYIRIFVTYFWRVLLRFFAPFRCLSCACKGGGISLSMGLFYAHFGEDGARYIPGTGREKRKSAPPLWWCALAFALVSLIGNGL